MKSFFKIALSVLFAGLLTFQSLYAQQSQELVNRKIFDKVYASVKADADKPMGELTLIIAKQFLGTEYVAATLEKEPEALQVFLDKTDCILFVELSSCFALTVKGYKIVQRGDGRTFSLNDIPSVEKAEPSYELLCHNIQNMRYRLGVVDGYPSRIHYTSEWILQNQTNGILKEFSSSLGEEFTQHFSYMSSHTGSYKQLKDNPSNVARIRSMEENLQAQLPYYYISQERLNDPQVISQIHDGDIITFISPVEGLDLAHVAIACTFDGKMHFIHASSKAMKVIIEPKTLAEYSTNGIRISRFNPSL